MHVMRLQREGIFVRDTGMFLAHIPSISDTTGIHTHDFCEVFLVTDGEVIHVINGIKQDLREGSLVFVRQNDVHFYEKCSSKDCKIINLAFESSYIKKVFEYLEEKPQTDRLMTSDISPHVLLSENDKAITMGCLDTLHSAIYSHSSMAQIQLRGLLAFLFSKLFLAEKTEELKQTPAWLANLLDEMQQKEYFSKGIEVLPALCCKTKEHISRSFKKYLDKTPTQYINEVRLNYAMHLLKYTDQSVMDICMDSGFESVSYFYSLFQKQFHTSPGRFRQQNRLSVIPD